MRSKDGSDGGYEVGYGKPPSHTRFKPGQSGNPNGRPRGSKNRIPPISEPDSLEQMILDEGNRLVPLRDGSKEISIEMKRALIRMTNVNAVKGSVRAQRIATDLIIHAERRNEEKRSAFFAEALALKERLENEYERRKRTRISTDDLLLKPEDVVLDFNTGRAHIRGPLTKEEKPSWDRWREMRLVYEKELAELELERDDPGCPNRRQVLLEIDKTDKMLLIVKVALDGSREAMKLLDATYHNAVAEEKRRNDREARQRRPRRGKPPARH